MAIVATHSLHILGAPDDPRARGAIRARGQRTADDIVRALLEGDAQPAVPILGDARRIGRMHVPSRALLFADASASIASGTTARDTHAD